MPLTHAHWFYSLSPHGCQVHNRHRPGIRRAGGRFSVDGHHILPQTYGGVPTWSDPLTGEESTNIVYVCPTGHVAIHELLRAWIEGEREPEHSILMHYSAGEKRFAQLGYERWVTMGKPHQRGTDPTDAPVDPPDIPAKG